MATTQVGSHTVYYDDLGAGHPIVLLTGLGASRLGWRKQLEPFSARYRVINMDNRDSGDSLPDTGPYGIADLADDVRGVIQNLKLERIYLAGISMGGFISMELAIRHPELVEKLVLVSTSAGGSTNVQPKPEILTLLVPGEAEDIEQVARRTFTAITGKGFMDAHPEDLEEIVKIMKEKAMPLESFQRQLGAAMVHDATDRLDRISAPTLVIHGDYDPLIPYENGQYLAAHIKAARLSTYPGVGHLPIIEAADRFNREVLEFLG